MKTRASSFVACAATAIALVLAASRVASAETPAAVALRLEGAQPGEGEPLRAAISQELPPGVAVSGEQSGPAAGSARLVVTMRQADASVRYEGPDGRVLERTIELPVDPAKRREIVALLVANMVRDEASDLEAALRGPPRPPPPPPAPVVPPPPPAAVSAEPPGPCDDPADPRIFVLDAVPGVGFPPSARVPSATTHLHGAFIGNYPGSVQGISASILGSYRRRALCGLDVAGFGSHVAGRVDGAQLAGFAVWGGDVLGYQGAPLTVARRSLVGAQTGVVAIAGRVEGAQVASVNIAESIEGIQLGAVNVSKGEALVQAGAVNLGGDAGLQLGAVNLARRASVPIGVVNVAEEADYPLGLVNVIRKGRTHLDVLAWDYTGVSGELVHGGKYTHAIQGVGVRGAVGASLLPFFYLGIGGHIPLSAPGFLRAIDVDVLSHFLPGKGFRDNTQLSQIRVLGTLSVFGAKVLVGPTVNVSLAPNDTSKISPFATTFVDRGSSQTVRLWPGVAAGLRFF